jgi:hypothetical protein
MKETRTALPSFIAILLVAALPLVCPAPAAAQQATEIYIPIGQSPGVSGKISVIGTIESYDHAARTLTVRLEGEAARTETARLTEQTRIWLDRTELRSSNRLGERTDCEPGRRIEVKFEQREGARTSEAEWVKIEIGEG